MAPATPTVLVPKCPQPLRRKRKQDGAVMLVVMLILMLATASAAVSIRSTQAELQAAGQDRISLQARHASEAAMVSMITYIDKLGEGGRLGEQWSRWSGLEPEMYRYGEPDIKTAEGHQVVAEHQAVRLWADSLHAVRQANEVAPLSNPVAGGDTLGSFGPNQAYGLPVEPNVADEATFAVDFTDCVRAPTGSTAGTQVDGGSGSTPVPVQFYCVLTARARIQLATPGTSRQWTFGSATYAQDPSAKEHDSRATILVPEFYAVPGS